MNKKLALAILAVLVVFLLTKLFLTRPQSFQEEIKFSKTYQLTVGTTAIPVVIKTKGNLATSSEAIALITEKIKNDPTFQFFEEQMEIKMKEGEGTEENFEIKMPSLEEILLEGASSTIAQYQKGLENLKKNIKIDSQKKENEYIHQVLVLLGKELKKINTKKLTNWTKKIIEQNQYYPIPEAKKAGEIYLKIAEEVSKISVPPSLLKLHNDLILNYYKRGFAFKNIINPEENMGKFFFLYNLGKEAVEEMDNLKVKVRTSDGKVREIQL